jgi:hypothetical protein
MDRYHGEPDPKTTDGYQKQAEQKAYRDAEGFIAMPANAIKACMRYASSELGAKKDSKKNRQTVAAGVFFQDEFFPIETEGKKIKKHDGLAQDLVTRGKGDKVTRVQTYRPLIRKWVVKGEMYLFGLQANFAKQCLELGGLRFGLLGHRPEFGRFVVTTFEVKK